MKKTYDASYGYPATEKKPVIDIPVRYVTHLYRVLAVRLPDLLKALEIPAGKRKSWSREHLNDLRRDQWWLDGDAGIPDSVWLQCWAAVDICNACDTPLALTVKEALLTNMDSCMAEAKKEKARMSFNTVRSIEDLCLQSVPVIRREASDREPETGAGKTAPEDHPQAAEPADAVRADAEAQADMPADQQETLSHRPGNSSGSGVWYYLNRWPLSGSAVAARFGISRIELMLVLASHGLIVYRPYDGYHLANEARDRALAVDKKADMPGKGQIRATLAWTPAGYARICEILAEENCFPLVEPETEEE